MKLSHEFFCRKMKEKEKNGIATEVPVWTDRFIFLGEAWLRGWAVLRGKNLV